MNQNSLTSRKPPKSFGAEIDFLEPRTTVRLHPRRGQDSDKTVSKLGGSIFWPRSEAWPFCEEHNDVLIPVLQLRIEEFPELMLDGAGELFQLLWCPQDHERDGYCPVPKVYIRSFSDCSEALETAPKLKNPDEGAIPIPCLLNPERVTEYPSAYELSKQPLEKVAAWVDENITDPFWTQDEEGESVYQYALSSAPGTKIGGYVDWIQNPEIPRCACGKDMDHLLTIASAEFDAGTYPRWMPVEEEHLWKVGGDARRAAQMAAGMYLGDMGSIYLFRCSICKPLKVRHVFQCS